MRVWLFVHVIRFYCLHTSKGLQCDFYFCRDRTDGSVESSMEYLQRIKDRLEEDSMAREERAKRRRKVLVDQMKAHQAQEVQKCVVVGISALV